MINFGTIRPGSTIYVPFDTYDGGTGASLTMTGLALADIRIYKNGSTTERASTSGFTLLDTDGTDFDGLTGLHGVSIDLSDNTTAGFYTAGSRYLIGIASVTVDGQTVNFWAGRFEIGYPDAIINTTIASLSTQTSFTLTSAPAEANALVGCPVIIHDIASAVQVAYGIVTAYAVTTKTVTLLTAPTFAIATGDNISVYLPSNSRWLGAALPVNATIGTINTYTGNTKQTGDSFARIGATGSGLTSLAQASVLGALATAAGTGDPDSAKTIMGYIKQLVNVLVGTAGVTTWAAGAAPANAVSLSEALRYISDNLLTVDTVVDGIQADLDNGTDGLGAIKADTAAILTDTNELQLDDVPGLIAALNNVAATDIVSAGAITTLAGAVVNVDLVDTVTTNTDMRGTDNAALASVATEARLAELDAANLPAVTDGIQTDLSNGVDGLGAIKTAVDTKATPAQVATELATYDGPTNTEMLAAHSTTDALITTIDTVVDAILVDTDTTIPALIAALNDLSAAQVNAEVVDALATDTYAEPGQGAPAATTTLAAKINYLYKAWRNLKDNDGTTTQLYNDAGSVVDQKQTTSEAAGTVTKTEWISGP